MSLHGLLNGMFDYVLDYCYQEQPVLQVEWPSVKVQKFHRHPHTKMQRYAPLNASCTAICLLYYHRRLTYAYS